MILAYLLILKRLLIVLIVYICIAKQGKIYTGTAVGLLNDIYHRS